MSRNLLSVVSDCLDLERLTHLLLGLPGFRGEGGGGVKGSTLKMLQINSSPNLVGRIFLQKRFNRFPYWLAVQQSFTKTYTEGQPNQRRDVKRGVMVLVAHLPSSCRTYWCTKNERLVIIMAGHAAIHLTVNMPCSTLNCTLLNHQIPK